MSDISAISGAGTPAATESTNELAGALGQQTFLNLLTTQLQYQDPLDPMSNEAFVEQLATFSTLEELISINSTLEAVYMGVASMNNASMAALVGSEVVAMGDGLTYDGVSDPVELHYDAAEATTSATVTVLDSEGSVVWSGEAGTLEQGEGFYEWDGKKTNGERAKEGDYTFKIEGTDADGDDVVITTLLVGTVTEMDYSTGTPRPSIEGTPVDIADILRLTIAAEGSEEAPEES